MNKKDLIAIIRNTGITKFKLARKVRNAVFSYLQNHPPEKCNVKGHIMYLGEKDVLELSVRGEYEPEETKIFLDNIKDGDVVLDIGAHIGYYTLLAARAVGDNGKVFSFEPEPSNFALLKKNIEINGYHNVVAVQKAVSDKNGKVKLFLSNGAGNNFFNISSTNKFVEVDVIKMDDFEILKQFLNKNIFIKMDSELSEPAALRGMQEILRIAKSVKMLVEFEPESYSISKEDPDSFLNMVTNLGFKITKIGERTIFCRE